MKNPAKYVRESVYGLLNGAVFYNSTAVPVYSSEGVTPSASVPYQINIMEYSDTDNSDRHAFRANATQVIEVVAFEPRGGRMAVDEIGELVMERISPTPSSVSTLSGFEMEVFTQEKPSQNYITETSGEGSNKIVRLILRYSLLITQKNN